MLAAAAVMDLQFAHASKLLLQPYQRSRDNLLRTTHVTVLLLTSQHHKKYLQRSYTCNH
jgi:hypothetical protein